MGKGKKRTSTSPVPSKERANRRSSRLRSSSERPSVSDASSSALKQSLGRDERIVRVYVGGDVLPVCQAIIPKTERSSADVSLSEVSPSDVSPSADVSPSSDLTEESQLQLPPRKSTRSSSCAGTIVQIQPRSANHAIWKLKATTCLSVGLDPVIHGNIICEGCRDYYTVKLKSCLENQTKIARSTKQGCHRPWFCGEKTTAGKIDRRDRILALFSPVSPTADEQPPDCEQEQSPANVNGRSLAHSFANAGAGSETVACKYKPTEITPNNRNKKKQGAKRLFDSKNQITRDLTARILESLEGREALNSHECQLLDHLSEIRPLKKQKRMLNENNTITTELTTLLRDSLHDRTSLEHNEKELRD